MTQQAVIFSELLVCIHSTNSMCFTCEIQDFFRPVERQSWIWPTKKIAGCYDILCHLVKQSCCSEIYMWVIKSKFNPRYYIADSHSSCQVRVYNYGDHPALYRHLHLHKVWYMENSTIYAEEADLGIYSIHIC